LEAANVAVWYDETELRQASPWGVIVEPDTEAKLLVVVTVYEVSE
jgi:hypothetical protein